MSEPTLKKGMKAFAVPKKGGKFFHVRSTLLKRFLTSGHSSTFKEAADLILETHLSSKGPHRDSFLYPVAYLYRHGLELALKELVILCVVAEHYELEDVEDILDKHALCPLWNKAKSLILEWEPDDKKAAFAEAVINEFHHLDKDGQTLRYDRKKGTFKYTDYTKLLPSHVDVDNLLSTTQALFDYLGEWKG